MATQSRPRGLNPALPRESGGAGLGGDVLEEEQTSAGPENPTNLEESLPLIADRAQDERGYDHVEAGRGQSQVRGIQGSNLGVGRAFTTDALRELSPHVRIGLPKDEPFHLRPVVGKVRAGSGADFQHLTIDRPQELGPPLGEAGALGADHERVVEGCK